MTSTHGPVLQLQPFRWGSSCPEHRQRPSRRPPTSPGRQTAAWLGIPQAFGSQVEIQGQQPIPLGRGLAPAERGSAFSPWYTRGSGSPLRPHPLPTVTGGSSSAEAVVEDQDRVGRQWALPHFGGMHRQHPPAAIAHVLWGLQLPGDNLPASDHRPAMHRALRWGGGQEGLFGVGGDAALGVSEEGPERHPLQHQRLLLLETKLDNGNLVQTHCIPQTAPKGARVRRGLGKVDHERDLLPQLLDVPHKGLCVL
mmetsp:Transcript_42079/g.75328  ORF Transcript_42079/g.75328 Transcript_42079/m.75328 type:complete len:253 (-) Transcript_42079:962-1720(-)